MSRPIDVTMLGHLNNDITIYPFIAIGIVTGSGSFYYKTNDGNITIGGNSYLGDGSLVAITALTENRELNSMGITVTFSGLNSALLAALVANNSGLSSVSVYIGLQDQNNNLIGNPISMGPYLLSSPTIELSETSFIMGVTIEDYLHTLSYTNSLCFNDFDQEARYAGDLFFSLLPTLGYSVMFWGNKQVNAGTDGVGAGDIKDSKGSGFGGGGGRLGNRRSLV